VRQEQWVRYTPTVEYHLTASYEAMRVEGRNQGLVLDLGPFTEGEQPYQVWQAKPVTVENQNESKLLGKLAIAGYTRDLWFLPKEQLPTSVSRSGLVSEVRTGFYQIHREHAAQLEVLNEYLTNAQSPPCPITSPIRRRVVLLIETERPAFIFQDVNRFRKKKAQAAIPAQPEVHDAIPPEEAVFQWWWGDPYGGIGHWKNYHPHVCANLEKALATNTDFQDCKVEVPIDEVRYCLRRISRDNPFDYVEQSNMQGFREPFLPSHVVTVEHGLFEDVERASGNCFVQFQRGNPKRRRPVRRVRRGETAGLEISGEPCNVCFSDTGFMTGCDFKHVICESCCRAGLRIMVGDISQTDNLLCGCLTVKDGTALEGLAHRADTTMQALIQNPPENAMLRREFDLEVLQLRRAFTLADRTPPDIFRSKVNEWVEKVKLKATEHLYHACCHPGCGMENWILQVDFDREYRGNGRYIWHCRKGHKNSVLPVQEDIDEMNRNILMHPEFYTDRCGLDSMALRRYRLCPGCVTEGLLTFAVHESGCKQWPGTRNAHRHCFCFHCTRTWGSGHDNTCTHSVQCRDPGIQQVRTITGADGLSLEIGFIDAEAYKNWVRGRGQCPPTRFPTGSVLGLTRQGNLGMEDKNVLNRAMREGTR